MDNQCRICGETNTIVLQTHHIVPRRFGGSDSNKNLVTLCANCHQAVESIYDDRFYEKLGFDPSTKHTTITYNNTVQLVKDFLDEQVTIGASNYETTEKLYAKFAMYAKQNDAPSVPPKNQFGKALRDVEPVEIERRQLRIDGKRTNVYTNVELD